MVVFRARKRIHERLQELLVRANAGVPESATAVA